jgi:hypothetical protein
VLAAAVIGVGGFALAGTGEPLVGDCITTTDDLSFDVVDCGSAETEYKIVGVQDGTQSQEEYMADPDTCSAFPDTEYAAWYGAERGQGTVYCAGSV